MRDEIQPDSRHTDELDPRVARSRDKILCAATELIVEGGPSAATVDAVSARAGVSKATLYRQWSSQSELLIDTFRCNMPDVVGELRDVNYRSAIGAMMDNAVEHLSSETWRNMLMAMFSFRLREPEATELMNADHETKLESIGQILAMGRAEGELSADTEPELAVTLLMGPVIFAALQDNGQDLNATAQAAMSNFFAAAHLHSRHSGGDAEPAATGGDPSNDR